MIAMTTLLACGLSFDAIGKVPSSNAPLEDDAPTDDGHPPVKADPVDNRAPRAKRVALGPMTKVQFSDPSIGGARSAWVRVPEGDGPFPVLMGFHGGKGNDGTAMVNKLKAAEDKGILLVYPNGGDTAKGSGWTGPGKEDGEDPMRDVRYVDHLLDELTKRFPVDPERIYATGHSGGAYMADLLWCHRNARIAGFGVVSRAMPIEMSQDCEMTTPRPYVLVLGTKDDGVVNEHQMSFSETRRFIIGKLGCSMAPDDTRTLPDKGDNVRVEHAHWSCSQDGSFDYYEVDGGGHSWPGVGRSRPDKAMDLDATQAMLRAFDLP